MRHSNKYCESYCDKECDGKNKDMRKYKRQECLNKRILVREGWRKKGRTKGKAASVLASKRRNLYYPQPCRTYVVNALPWLRDSARGGHAKVTN
jgi:hypothetical protein